MGSNILKIAIGILYATLLSSCSVMSKENRFARNQDLFNRFSRHTLVAIDASKMSDDFLILRRNSTFVYRTKFMGATNLSYYTGTYTLRSGVLKLNFDPEHTPSIDNRYDVALAGKDLTLRGTKDNFAIVENPHKFYNLFP